MHSAKKISAKKLREKEFALQANAAKCSKITEMIATTGTSPAPVADYCSGGDGGSELAVSWAVFITLITM